LWTSTFHFLYSTWSDSISELHIPRKSFASNLLSLKLPLLLLCCYLILQLPIKNLNWPSCKTQGTSNFAPFKVAIHDNAFIMLLLQHVNALKETLLGKQQIPSNLWWWHLVVKERSSCKGTKAWLKVMGVAYNPIAPSDHPCWHKWRLWSSGLVRGLFSTLNSWWHFQILWLKILLALHHTFLWSPNGEILSQNKNLMRT
jgi:hypothetical protein